MNRRNGLAVAFAGVVGAAAIRWPPHHLSVVKPTVCPGAGDRKFVDGAVESKILEVKRFLGVESQLAWMFENCFPNTLDTTVRLGVLGGEPDTFVITGDIPAMWLRDSTAQVWPYLSLVARDQHLKALITGVINRQSRCILIDPYANAFNYDGEGSEFEHDLTAMKPQLHKRKWEIDSLCYPVRLSHGYWKATGATTPFQTRARPAMRVVRKTI